MLTGIGRYGVSPSRDGGSAIRTHASVSAAPSKTRSTGVIQTRGDFIQEKSKRESAKASFNGSGTSGLSSSQGGFASTGTAVTGLYNKAVLDDYLAHNDEHQMRQQYRDIYLHDSIAGSAIDLMSELPFSDFTLSGLPNQEMLQNYAQSLDAVNVKLLLPELTRGYNVYGAFIGVTNFDNDKKRFTSIMPQDINMCEITPLPIYGRDPIIDLKIPPEIKKLMQSSDPRIKEAFSKYGDNWETMIKDAKFPLEPKDTLYVPRRTFATNSLGTSLLRRILPVWLVEKALLRGTIDLAWRRQRAVLQVIAGDEEWEPTNAELTEIVNMFISADVDPTGAIVGTRPGVQVQEFRQGGDFWRWDEMYDVLASVKMRSLGISDAFLSSEACMVGSTIVPTTNGLIEIGAHRKRQDGKWQNTDAKVLSRFGIEKAAKWFYNGIKPTLKITTELGNKIQATYNHKPLVFDENTGVADYVRMDQIKVDDYLCVNLKKTVRTSALKLDLSKPPENHYHGGQRQVLNRPSEMTPDLAYLIGAIVAEGSIGKKGGQTRFGNTDPAYMIKIRECFANVFGIDTYEPRLALEAGSCYEDKKLGFMFANKDMHELIVCSRTLVEWWEQLGLYADGNKEKKAAHYKSIPWSIMQADEQSQLAFLAAYIEGDGSTTHRIQVISASNKTLVQMQAMLFAHGIISRRKQKDRIQIEANDASDLWERMLPYRCSKELLKINHRGRQRYGVPITFVQKLLAERKQYHNRHGIVFIDDNGHEVHIRGFKNVIRNHKVMPYDMYDQGAYNLFLSQLKQISVSTWKKLTEFLKLRYFFAKATVIQKGGKKHTYDFSIESGREPAYVGNGLVVHNTLSNMETSLSVFLDQIRAYRELITRKVFYQRLFPIIAQENGYRIDNADSYATTGAMANLSTREMQMLQASTQKWTKVRNRNGKKEHYAVIGNARFVHISDDNEDIDVTKLLMPRIQWHKTLKPEADQSYLEIMGTIAQAGLPIPLRMWAAAGGMSISEIMSSLKDDVKQRNKIAAYQKLLPQAPADQAASMFQQQAATANAHWLSGMKRNRTFDNLELRDPSTGKVLSVKGRNLHSDRFNKKGAQALARSAQRENHEIKEQAQAARLRAYSYNKGIFGDTTLHLKSPSVFSG